MAGFPKRYRSYKEHILAGFSESPHFSTRHSLCLSHVGCVRVSRLFGSRLWTCKQHIHLRHTALLPPAALGWHCVIPGTHGSLHHRTHLFSKRPARHSRISITEVFQDHSRLCTRIQNLCVVRGCMRRSCIAAKRNGLKNVNMQKLGKRCNVGTRRDRERSGQLYVAAI